MLIIEILIQFFLLPLNGRLRTKATNVRWSHLALGLTFVSNIPAKSHTTPVTLLITTLMTIIITTPKTMLIQLPRQIS